ncbi:flagellar hook-associated protein FlgL [Anaerobacillus sp. MEB173]|uniref:flagellar hook-associated protein FlgL n=1 Tax=Anaerobacillus sp. MEB173 TaxID=3383345 RepID=UPI003F91A316
MRVTQTMLSNSTLRHISHGYANLSKIQDQLASGKKITRASQDPVVAMNGMRYRTQVAEISQFRRNLSETYNWMEQADSALTEVTQALQRIRELTVQASNDTYDRTQRANIAKEIQQLNDHIASIGNTQVNSRYIFNGTNTATAPVDLGKLDNFIKKPEIAERVVTQLPATTGTVAGYNRTITTTYEGFAVEDDGTVFTDAVEIELKFPDPPELDGLPANRSFFGEIINGELRFDEQDPELRAFFDYYSTDQSADLSSVQINVNNGTDIVQHSFTDLNGALKIGKPIQLSFTPADLGATANTKVLLTIDGEEIELQYNGNTGRFEWDVPENPTYTVDQINEANITVMDNRYNFEFSATDVENPNDYFMTVKIDGKEFKLIYDETTKTYKNDVPIRTNTPLKDLEALEGNVFIKPEASPTSTNEQHVEMELLKGVNISPSVKPQNVFSNGFFRDLKEIIDQIGNLGEGMDGESGDHEFISSFIDKIDGHIGAVVSEQAELGARMNRIELMEMRIMQQEETAKRILSNNEDADMEEVIIGLTTQESVHRAALAAGARIIQPSLLDFLR